MSVSVQRGLSAAVLSAVLLAGLAATPAAATVAGVNAFVVTTLADTSATDGACSLREVLADTAGGVGTGDTAAGECGQAGAGPYGVIFSVSGTITLGSNLPPVAASITIDGGNKVVIDGANAYRGLFIIGGPAVIENLTIDHGHATDGNGAGVFNQGDAILQHVTIQNSTVTGATSLGGGIYSTSPGSLQVRESVVNADEAQNGGGIVNDSGTLDLLRTTVSGDISADNGGGVLTIGSGTTTLTDSTVSGNQSGASGAGIAGRDTGTTILSGTTVTNNTSLGNGAGLWGADDTTTWTIATSTISGNSADAIGGGFGGKGALTVVTSTISGNTASSQGPGLGIEGGTAVIANSTIAGNSGLTGAGFYAESGASATLTNDTITLNTSSAGDVITNGGGTITLKNTIVAGNTAATISSGTVDTTVANLVATSSAGILDPAGLKDNGGPTKTVELLATATDAINQGDSATCAAAPVLGYDQRGVTRPAACDIGAVERDTTAPSSSAPRTQLLAPGKIGSSSVPVNITAVASDPGGSGVARFILQRSIAGGTWTTVTSTMPAGGITVSQAVGKAYRYRVRPVDHDGNTGAWTSASASATASIVQQTSSAVTYHGTWSSTSSSSYSGGSEKYAKAKGAYASFVFTGRGVALVGTTGPGRGQARIYVNGTLTATVDLGGVTTAYRAVIWRGNWSSSAKRTVKVVVVATTGRPRVDLDAFTVLK